MGQTACMSRSRILTACVALTASATVAWHLGDIWAQRSVERENELDPVGQYIITDVVAYQDAAFDFQLTVPAGWVPVVAIPEGYEQQDGLAVAHSVSFEAPREYPGDVFSDYVMIEIIPGSRSGKFVTDGSQAEAIVIDGFEALRESLAIDQYRLGKEVLDLVVHQAEIKALGYTVGFYAIGEPRNRQLLDDAFELMIQSFAFSIPPYRVS